MTWPGLRTFVGQVRVLGGAGARGRRAGVGKRSFRLPVSTLEEGVLRQLPDDDVEEVEEVRRVGLQEDPDEDVVVCCW